MPPRNPFKPAAGALTGRGLALRDRLAVQG
jgi:hypothetical protein